MKTFQIWAAMATDQRAFPLGVIVQTTTGWSFVSHRDDAPGKQVLGGPGVDYLAALPAPWSIDNTSSAELKADPVIEKFGAIIERQDAARRAASPQVAPGEAPLGVRPAVWEKAKARDAARKAAGVDVRGRAVTS